MSTASPLPLQPLPLSTVSAQEQHQLRQQVSARLQEHRRRRPQEREQADLPGMDMAAVARRPSRVADSVAARFAQSVSYRDFLEQEAESAIRQAEAAAEVARRSADAIAAAQMRLLDEIDQWNRTGENLPAASAEAQSTPDAKAPLLTIPSAGTATAPTHAVSAAEAASSVVAASIKVTARVEPRPAAPVSELLAKYAAAVPMIETAVTVLPAVEPELPREPTVALPTNLIEFPRQLVAARKARPRLAEGPLREDADAAPERAQLRIFEVEPDAFSSVPAAAVDSTLPEWSNIRLGSWLEADTAAAQAEALANPVLPLYAAPVSQRMMALAVDVCCIGTAFLLAVAAAAYAVPELPEGRFALIAAAGTLLLFGVLYLSLFFTLSEATPGMRYARIALCTFGDENPTRSAMRRRLLAMVLSAVPVGLGFAWALLDDDRLGWHDRISRMYQRAY